MESPKVTYYARVIDNLTENEILKSTNAMDNNVWYYGKCNGKEGGESEYLVEFDIWNNEPAFNAGTYDSHCEDALNCRLTVWPTIYCVPNENELFTIDKSFMHARCITQGYNDFKPIKYNDMLTGIVGNVNPRQDSIKGSGDHAIVQTKIILPENSNLSTKRYDFVFAFYYDFE